MNATAAAADGQRIWWLRTLLVLQAPRAVFAALRDESPDAVEARQEPITALVFLGGIAAVLMTPSFGTLYDDPEVDALLVLVIAIFAGGIYGFFVYWLGGWALSRGAHAVGSGGSARLSRHVIAFASAPLALSLIVWPLRLALYGGDVFRTGGTDAGAGGDILRWATIAFALWTLALLVYGVRVVHGFSWFQALAASGAAVMLTAAVLAAWVLLDYAGGE